MKHTKGPAPSDSRPGEQGSVLPQFHSELVALFASMRGRALLPSSVELEPKGPTHPFLGSIQAPPSPFPHPWVLTGRLPSKVSQT